MNNLIVKGVKNIEGMKFHDIEGGFGEGKKAILVKEIANIHGRELSEINRRINENRIRFKDSVDIVDLKSEEFAMLLKHSGIYTQNSINASKNIYLLSERGYAKLLKILEDDKAWEQYDKLVDGYFQMREERNNSQYQYENLSTEMKALLMHDKKIQAVEKKVLEVDNKFEELPLFQNELKLLKKLVNQKVVPLLGGKRSPAYKPMSKKVFSDIYRQVHREFGVTCCEEIKRKDFELVKVVVGNYELPRALELDINMINRQVRFA